jgi:Lon protease-like protein
VSQAAFAEGSGQLPPTLPIFPLTGVLLLPGGRLPLNIFEPRYLAMTRDAMASHGMIGMIQPQRPEAREVAPSVYPLGCAGRITSFSETDDGRYLIVLTGVSRFRIASELQVTTPYRQVIADWEPFRADVQGDDAAQVDRERLMTVLRAYLDQHGIPAEWRAIERAPSDALVSSLAMVCPFSPSEKQALLEAPHLGERSRVMIALMEMAVLNRRAAGITDMPRGPLH